MAPKIDKNLIIQAEMLANGENIHKVSNLIAAYKGAYYFLIDSQNSESLELFASAEKAIQQFINKRRIEKTKNARKKSTKTSNNYCNLDSNNSIIEADGDA